MNSFIKSAVKKENYPDTNAEVVFVGRSNVGKSSLINALYGKIAYVGKTPGKTRLLNFFNINNQYTVCDAPGYGYAKRSDREIIEYGEMMEEYFETRENLKLCVMILDVRRVPNDDDIDMLNYLKQSGVEVLVLANKADKFSNNQLYNQKKIICKTLSLDDITCISTLKHSNIHLVTEKIRSKVEVND